MDGNDAPIGVESIAPPLTSIAVKALVPEDVILPVTFPVNAPVTVVT